MPRDPKTLDKKNRILATAVLFVAFACGEIPAPAWAESPEAEARQPVKHRIDTHIHLYDTTREPEIPWPSKRDPVLYKPHLPAEYNRVAKAAGVTGVVIVEASDRLDDNRWILDLVDGDDFYLGFVGNIDLTRDDFEEQLLKLKQDSRFVGIRPRGSGGIDYSDPQILAKLRLLAKHDLTLDMLNGGGRVAGIETIDQVARAIPDLHIVVNHCFGVRFDGQSPDEEWGAAVDKLAENKNVYVKISGLFQLSIPQPARQNPDHYLPYVNAIWDSFGDDHVIYGSNWPLTKRTGSYEEFLTLVDRIVSRKGQSAREHYYWKNAARAYRLPLN